MRGKIGPAILAAALTTRSTRRLRGVLLRASPVYGEANVTIAYRCVDLLWHPVGRLVRFVLVRHPVHGTLMLLSTDVTMDPLSLDPKLSSAFADH